LKLAKIERESFKEPVKGKAGEISPSLEMGNPITACLLLLLAKYAHTLK
jgi:hypothetical protein